MFGTYGLFHTRQPAIIIAPGEQSYITAGTYSWTAPEGVTSVCVVCVGGGASGGISRPAGGGGGLGWKNQISVVPGTSYTVVVGAGGLNIGQGGAPYIQRYGNDGGDSYFIDTGTVKGGGGQTSRTGGTYVGDSGGLGGEGGAGSGELGGGGGAGGYTGNGGKGHSWSYDLPTQGFGGGGGGGRVSGYSGYEGGGGGVGILGQGDSGGPGPTSQLPSGGYGGSGGANGAAKNGGAYGGGGSSFNGFNGVSGTGGGGAVRIIWGTGRSFPTNAA